MKYAVIQENKVVNVVVADSYFASQQGWIQVQDGVGPGWLYENGQFSKPVEVQQVLPPNYNGFWNALIQTPLYNKLRLASSQDLGANTFCTELIALFSDAKTGNANVPVIQLYFTILFFIFTFTEQELQDIQTLFESYNMLTVYTLPTPEFISTHQYDPVTNTIIPL